MKLAACAVDFNVGFFADQASGFEGISHFLEHMVFMGSEKYPGENHFSDWLSQHWGSENACTDSEQTTYYFDCHPKHLARGPGHLQRVLPEPAAEDGRGRARGHRGRVRVRARREQRRESRARQSWVTSPPKRTRTASSAGATERRSPRSPLWKDRVRSATHCWTTGGSTTTRDACPLTLLGEQDLGRRCKVGSRTLFRDMRADGVPKPDFVRPRRARRTRTSSP